MHKHFLVVIVAASLNTVLLQLSDEYGAGGTDVVSETMGGGGPVLR
jgi:hypothetical protein